MSKEPSPPAAEHTHGREPDDKREQTPTSAAQRALAEAAERRRIADQEHARKQNELGGREGPDPTRYGDWEKDGIASDF